MVGKPGRPRADAPALTREAIVAAGLRLLDTAGLNGFTMRALAAELGVTAMSVHHHVGSRQQLLAAMADAIYDARELEPGFEASTPREDIESLLLSYYRAVVAHPNLTLALFADPGHFGGAASRLTDRVTARLGQLGLDEESSVRWRNILIDHLHGAAIALAAAAANEEVVPTDPDFYSDALKALLDAVPATKGRPARRSSHPGRSSAR